MTPKTVRLQVRRVGTTNTKTAGALVTIVAFSPTTKLCHVSRCYADYGSDSVSETVLLTMGKTVAMMMMMMLLMMMMMMVVVAVMMTMMLMTTIWP